MAIGKFVLRHLDYRCDSYCGKCQTSTASPAEPGDSLAGLAAFLAPVLALLLLAALGRRPEILDYDQMRVFSTHWFGKLSLFAVTALFLWHVAHRLRITLFDLGLRQGAVAAVMLYLVAAAGTLLSLVYLARI